MTAIRIDNFGGEYPSLSVQALPGDGAQRNVNLYAGIKEFRPLLEDKNTGVSAPSTIKTIYRTQRKSGGGYNDLGNEASNWLVNTKELSYVKGQVNDDATERTYYTTDDGSDFPKAFDLATMNTPRKLGVPAPAKLGVTLVKGKSFTLEDVPAALKAIAKQLRDAIIECTIIPGDTMGQDPATAAQRQKASRYKDYVPSYGVPRAAKLTPLSGPKSNYGMGPTEEITEYLPPSWRDMHWKLYAARLSTEMQALFGDAGLERLGALSSNGNVALSLDALPFSLVPDRKDPANPSKYLLETKLRAFKNPRDDSALFDDAEVANMIRVIIEDVRPQVVVGDLLSQIDECVKKFATLVLDTNPSVLAPAPVKPTQPTTPQYTMVNGVSTEAPEWVAYRAALEKYNADFAAWQKLTGGVELTQQTLADRVAALQADSMRLSAQIESSAIEIFKKHIDEEHLKTALLGGFGGAEGLFGELDARRVKEARFYVATHVTEWGEESAPSPVSEMLEPTQYDTVDVKVATPPAGRYIKKVRLYRSNAGSTGSAFQFVVELNAQAQAQTHNDKLKSAQLGEGLATTTWLEPPSKLRGLVGMPNGIMAGFFDNTVCFCDPYHPYAWPVEYQITTEHPIVGLAAFDQTLFVGTTGSPYFISGSDSASMSALKMDSNQACSSRRSIVAVQGGVLFASPDGLCSAGRQGVSVITQGLFTREEWQALQPSTMTGAEHEGIYYLFYKGKGGGVFMLDMQAKKLTRITGLAAGAVFVDRLNDALYYSSTSTGRIHRAYGGTARRAGVWKSGRNPLAQHATMAWAQIEGDHSEADPVLLRLYGDGFFIDSQGEVYERTGTGWRKRSDPAAVVAANYDQTTYTVRVANNLPQRMPFGRWRDHEIEIESKARVTRVTLAGSTEELKSL